MPLDVVCPNCRQVFFETNDKNGSNPHVTGGSSQFVKAYDPNENATAAMIRLKDKFIGMRDDIPHDNDLTGEAIGPCPECLAPLSGTSFKLETREQGLEIDPSCICEVCGQQFPSERVKKIHRTMAHRKKV